MPIIFYEGGGVAGNGPTSEFEGIQTWPDQQTRFC